MNASLNEVDIYSRLNDIFRDIIGDESITLTPTTTADDIDGWDSSAHVSLMVAIEIAFNITIRTDEMESFKNVGDMVKLIQEKS